MSAVNWTIRLDDCTDWGGIKATDEDRAAYEQAVADAIGEAYPGSDVTVQCLQIAKARAVVTLRGDDGRVLADDASETRCEEIGARVLAIRDDVWDAGEFWPEAVPS